VWISRKPYAAKLKAADPWLDLAVLQVAADGLSPITLGDAARKGNSSLPSAIPTQLPATGSRALVGHRGESPSPRPALA
jgi:S1-C subfamily serine protease